jgi:hypothetical protein
MPFALLIQDATGRHLQSSGSSSTLYETQGESSVTTSSCSNVGCDCADTVRNVSNQSQGVDISSKVSSTVATKGVPQHNNNSDASVIPAIPPGESPDPSEKEGTTRISGLRSGSSPCLYGVEGPPYTYVADCPPQIRTWNDFKKNRKQHSSPTFRPNFSSSHNSTSGSGSGSAAEQEAVPSCCHSHNHTTAENTIQETSSEKK